MTETRAALDRKLTLLEGRARELSPRRYWNRNKPDFLVDRVIGGVLMLVGLRMAWGQVRARRDRRARVRAALASHGHW
jgi:hypothetical protein